MGTLSPMLSVKNMKETVQFYEKSLGFKMRMAYPDAENAQYVDLVKDGMVLMFTPAKSSPLGWLQKPGAGVNLYLMIDGDIDAYYKDVKGKGVAVIADIKDEPYGTRDFTVTDNNGYKLTFNQYAQGDGKCQSCGMPMEKAEDFGGSNPTNLCCVHCCNPDGSLKSYNEVFRGMVEFMMKSQKIDRDTAVQAVKEHMAKMPAWKGK
ncbi:MAG: VOC family protein [Dehalococcoidales bacterium]|nr:VOC family protein [Dehalococcoidales bacterium]